MFYLSFLVDDGNGVLQFDVIEKTGKEDVGDADQTVVFLLVKKRVRSAEIWTHYLDKENFNK